MLPKDQKYVSIAFFTLCSILIISTILTFKYNEIITATIINSITTILLFGSIFVFFYYRNNHSEFELIIIFSVMDLLLSLLSTFAIFIFIYTKEDDSDSGGVLKIAIASFDVLALVTSIINIIILLININNAQQEEGMPINNSQQNKEILINNSQQNERILINA